LLEDDANSEEDYFAYMIDQTITRGQLISLLKHQNLIASDISA